MYHEITDGNQYDSISHKIASSWITSEDRFETQMTFLKSRGHQVISLRKLLDILDDKIDRDVLHLKPVLITFDDGFEGNYKYGFPILQKHGMSASFFVATSNIGKKHMLTWQQLREMSNFKMSIQSHTLSHPLLSSLGFNETKKEIVDSKQIIQEKIGEKVEFISLPNGDYNQYYFKIAEENGYLGGCSSIYGFNNQKTNRFLLRRISIKKHTDIFRFQALINSKSLYAKWTLSKSLIKSGVSKVVGKGLYDKIYNALYGVESWPDLKE